MKDRLYQPYHDNLVALARINRQNPTSAEQQIWSGILRGKQLSGLKFLRQKPIDGYIVDFYCAALGLVIEIDGDSHADKTEYDAERTRILNAYGLHVIRYTNEEVINNLTGVHQHLSAEITLRQQIVSLNSSPDKGRLGGVSSTTSSSSQTTSVTAPANDPHGQ